jgi:hypothetical protein
MRGTILAQAAKVISEGLAGRQRLCFRFADFVFHLNGDQLEVRKGM